MTSITQRLNVYGKPLQPCNLVKITGYIRDGYCTNLDYDQGTHIVCSIVTDEFLKFTKSRGNDLTTSSKSFPGLKEGDKWCLCIGRWMEAYKNGKAPPVIGEATDINVLKYVPAKIFQQFLID